MIMKLELERVAQLRIIKDFIVVKIVNDTKLK